MVRAALDGVGLAQVYEEFVADHIASGDLVPVLEDWCPVLPYFTYQPLRKGRRERLEDLRTGDGRLLPVHLKAQIMRELDRLEVVLEQV
jgi:DNA-binding transcriptional LysR family regulator